MHWTTRIRRLLPHSVRAWLLGTSTGRRLKRLATAWPEHTSLEASSPSSSQRVASSKKTPAQKPSRPRLGLVGFFGHGNYGDELFLKVFDQFFGEDFDLKIIVDRIEKPYYSRRVEALVDEVDAIVIGGGDLIRPWALDPRWFNTAYLRKPVYMVGLGAAIRPNTVEKDFVIDRYARFFRDPNVRFIGVRDDVSRRWVESRLAPDVEVRSEPDIVCALDLPSVERRPDLLGIITRLRPNREVPDDYSALEQLALEVMSRGWSVRHIIAGTGLVGERDLANSVDLHVPGKELVASEDLDVLTAAIGECTALASMKFHGSVVATMYGVPSLVLVPTSKNVTFMKRIERADLLAHFEADDLLTRFQPMPASHDEAAIAMLRERATDLMSELAARIHADVLQSTSPEAHV